MKKCRRCTKTATLHVTEIREGKAVAVHLCDTCAREYLEQGGPDETVFPELPGKLSDVMAETAESQAVCPNCGITFREFREHGRFGCAQDYTEFMAELIPLLESIHEDSRHVGKQPRGTIVGTKDQSRLSQLRNQQRTAIEKEDYEAAAVLRDQILELEAKIRTPTPPKSGRRRKPPGSSSD
jgi:protein arginine kinase activator